MTHVSALLGPIGLASAFPYTDDAAVVVDEARHAEQLGFSTLWRSGNLPMVDAAVRATDAIGVATGIISVSAVAAPDVIATYSALQRDQPTNVSDRLLDGICAWGDIDSIAARVAEYRSQGADQVVLRILGVEDLAAWRTRLAEALIHAG